MKKEEIESIIEFYKSSFTAEYGEEITSLFDPYMERMIEESYTLGRVDLIEENESIQEGDREVQRTKRSSCQ